jgi:hypothetical protein
MAGAGRATDNIMAHTANKTETTVATRLGTELEILIARTVTTLALRTE